MPFDINFAAINTGNPLRDYLVGREAGQKIRQDRARQEGLNVLARDPSAGAESLIASGNADAAREALQARNVLATYQANEVAKPYASKGDYTGAARAAGAYDVGVARQLESFGQEQLDHTAKVGKRSAAVLMAAAQIPDPNARRAFVDQHADELTGLGYSHDQIAGYDLSDPTKMRADAARFLDLSDLAGKMSVEKFGDYAVTYETNPVTGTRPVSRTEIPATRSDRRQDAEFAYRQEHDAEELRLARAREARESANATNPDSSPAKVMGPIFRKMANGEPLTEGETRALQYYKLDPLTAAAVDGGAPAGGEYGDAPPVGGRGGPAPYPASSAGGHAAPPPPAARAGPPAPPPQALQQLKEGQTTTFANGQAWTLKGGKPVRVR